MCNPETGKGHWFKTKEIYPKGQAGWAVGATAARAGGRTAVCASGVDAPLSSPIGGPLVLLPQSRNPGPGWLPTAQHWEEYIQSYFLFVVCCLVCAAFDSFIFDAPFWPCKLFLVIIYFYL